MRTALAASLTALLLAGTAQAQDSEYGCRRLQEAEPRKILEGENGNFYRVSLDMRMNHALSEEAARLVGEIARGLAERGTEMIYVPVPTKSLAVPGDLPAEIADYAFDLDIAEEGYAAYLEKLRGNGVSVIDTVAAMRGAEARPFIGTDFHWSPEGAASVARAVADHIRDLPGYAEMERTTFETTRSEPIRIDSALRQDIQSWCRETIPLAKVTRYETEIVSDSDASGGIFASDAGGPPIVLAGTSMSAEEHFHFEGFLSQYAEASVANFSITGGNQYGGLTAYLMSEDFREDPPEVLIWENPIYNNLGDFGESRLRELLAAVAAECTPLETTRDGLTTLSADLPDGEVPAQGYVEVDTGSPNGRSATFRFGIDSGGGLEASIVRPDRFEPSRYFIRYLEPLWRPDLDHVSVELDQPATEDATLSICETKETNT